MLLHTGPAAITPRAAPAPPGAKTARPPPASTGRELLGERTPPGPRPHRGREPRPRRAPSHTSPRDGATAPSHSPLPQAPRARRRCPECGRSREWRGCGHSHLPPLSGRRRRAAPAPAAPGGPLTGPAPSEDCDQSQSAVCSAGPMAGLPLSRTAQSPAAPPHEFKESPPPPRSRCAGPSRGAGGLGRARRVPVPGAAGSPWRATPPA